ncbi:hypothetical protein CXK94_15600 [Stutzerimonas stutzeri]|uniref:Arylsulfotransferase (ASST) n=1 Tax=Stutzerimonas stutzeri TaxID=316 RepID=A0A2N8T2I1_STUST|nr:arylsulfotransferase family protein [Stutzerimonas stutzeri]MCQ4326683.1 arylsulfotransferase family protein [Stutzerimonas stutzeri]PNG08923.1 hypothetical protein CXK94_15600 [Stutzerimonas stutzeri]
MDKADRAGFALFCAAMVFLAFVGGAFVVLSKSFPYSYFNDAYKAAQATFGQLSATNLHTETHLWREARRDDRGVTVNNTELAYPGLTLYTSGDGSYANLIDLDGKIVHRWELPYRDIWDKNPEGRAPRPQDRIYWDKVRLLPNGDLLVVITADNDTPWGYGLIRIDRDSKLVWAYHGAAHHDLVVTPDGRIVTLTHGFSEEDIPGLHALERPWLDDFLVVLDGETGTELSKVSLARALLDSRYAEPLYQTPSYATADPLHANSVEYLDEARSAAFAPARGNPGQVLVSFRNIGTLALVDPQSGALTWATRGPWLVQHDARVLPNGNLSLFDNAANYRERNISRVLEVNPRNHEVVWSYEGTDEHPFESYVRSSAETLPNGNRIITESDGGRLFEVTPSGEIAWEFINPVRGGEDDRYIPIVSSGQRIPYGALDTEFRNLIDNER